MTTAHLNIRFPEVTLDIWELQDGVQRVFEEAFGPETVVNVEARKYPSLYEVTVTVRKRELEAMYDLANQLQEHYRRRGFPVGISIEEQE
jgi:hypothetical protein